MLAGAAKQTVQDGYSTLTAAVDAGGGQLALVGLAVLVAGGGLICRRVARRPHRLRLAVLEEVNEWVCRLWYRFRRLGPCTVPESGPVIIAANHTCTADPLMVCTGCQYRKISFLIAREYADLRFWRFFVRAADCIPVRRDGRDVAATKQALRRLQAGDALGIFIQGRIPAPGQQVELRDGIAMLALRSGAAVIPCHISGTLYRDGVLAGFLAPHRVRVRFGPPVDLSDLAAAGGGRRTISAATKRIHEHICALAPEGQGDTRRT